MEAASGGLAAARVEGVESGERRAGLPRAPSGSLVRTARAVTLPAAGPRGRESSRASQVHGAPCYSPCMQCKRAGSEARQPAA